MNPRMVMDYPVDLDVLPDVEREDDDSPASARKGAGLTFAEALLIVKGRGVWNEALHPRDNRGRFRSRNALPLTVLDSVRSTLASRGTGGSARLARTSPSDSGAAGAAVEAARARIQSTSGAAVRAAVADSDAGGTGGVRGASRTLGDMTAPKITREVPTKFKDLKVGDRIKSYVDFIPEGKITRAPQRGQSGYDLDVQWGDGKPERQFGDGDKEWTVLTDEPEAPKPKAPRRKAGELAPESAANLRKLGAKRAELSADEKNQFQPLLADKLGLSRAETTRLERAGMVRRKQNMLGDSVEITEAGKAWLANDRGDSGDAELRDKAAQLRADADVARAERVESGPYASQMNSLSAQQARELDAQAAQVERERLKRIAPDAEVVTAARAKALDDAFDADSLDEAMKGASLADLNAFVERHGIVTGRRGSGPLAAGLKGTAERVRRGRLDQLDNDPQAAQRARLAAIEGIDAEAFAAMPSAGGGRGKVLDDLNAAMSGESLDVAERALAQRKRLFPKYESQYYTPRHIKDVQKLIETGRTSLPSSMAYAQITRASWVEHFTPDQRAHALGELLSIEATLKPDARDRPGVEKAIAALKPIVPGDHDQLKREGDARLEPGRKALRDMTAQARRIEHGRAVEALAEARAADERAKHDPNMPNAEKWAATRRVGEAVAAADVARGRLFVAEQRSAGLDAPEDADDEALAMLGRVAGAEDVRNATVEAEVAAKAPAPVKPPKGPKPKPGQRFVTLPDGTKAKRTSANPYTHAVVVQDDHHAQARATLARVDRMDANLDALEEALKSGDFSGFVRVPNGWSGAGGTHYTLAHPDFADAGPRGSDFGLMDRDASMRHPGNVKDRERWAANPGSWEAENRKYMASARERAARDRAEAEGALKASQFTYGVVRWSQRADSAEAARSTFEGVGRKTRVVAVDDPDSGPAVDPSTLFGPSRRAQDAALQDAQARQREFDRGRGVGKIARDLLDIEAKGHADTLSMDELRERVRGQMEMGELSRKDGGPASATVLGRLEDALTESTTFGELRQRVDALMAGESTTFGGRPGDVVPFDPARMEPLAGAPGKGDQVQVERPALMRGDVVLERAVVTRVATPAADRVSYLKTLQENARKMYGDDMKTWTARQQADYAKITRELKKLGAS